MRSFCGFSALPPPPPVIHFPYTVLRAFYSTSMSLCFQLRQQRDGCSPRGPVLAECRLPKMVLDASILPQSLLFLLLVPVFLFYFFVLPSFETGHGMICSFAYLKGRQKYTRRFSISRVTKVECFLSCWLLRPLVRRLG